MKMTTPRSLLQLKDGVKSFGARTIFSNTSFSVNEGEKIGVIGPNGAGKSTLFRILVGEENLDGGQITRAKGLRIGYLEQEDHWSSSITVEEHLASQTATPIWEVKQLAPSLGLSLDVFPRSVMSLSGGYRMRVKLLYLLASKPDLMLLDEPTNYLDLETLVVLENFLQSTTSAFMLISHDREFLRRTTDHILEVEDGQMTKYAGHIDDYFEQKALLREQLLRAQENAEAKRKAILEFVARFGAKATKARQAQSRLKQLEKMEAIEVRPLQARATIHLPEPVRTGKTVLRAESVRLGYGEKVVIDDLNLELNRGDHLGVVGLNGAGKSTLLKALAGELKPLKGEISYGMNVSVGYFAQHVAESLSHEDTVLEAMGEFASADTKRQEILDLAGALLFSGDDVMKKVDVLSGGEKSRVALGRILLKKCSLLLLDEPTNHLDFDTVEALTQALAEFSGTVVIVSHDRGFVRRVASKILEVRDGRALVYPGSYDEYVWSVQKGALAALRAMEQNPEMKTERAQPESGESEKTEKFNFKERKKQLEKELRTLEKELMRLDKECEEMRAQMIRLNEELAVSSGASAIEKAKEIGLLQAEIDKREAIYLEYLERNEALHAALDRFKLAHFHGDVDKGAK